MKMNSFFVVSRSRASQKRPEKEFDMSARNKF